LDTQLKIKQRKLDEPIPLLTHLAELRKRLVYAVIAVAVCGFGMYPLVDIVIRNLAKPVGKFIFTGPVEAFWSRLTLAFFLGLFASMPFVLFQFWSFIQAGLLPKEKRSVGVVTVISFCLFAAGASFCYFLILPVGVQFLLAYGSDVLVPMISFGKYLSFVGSMVFAFGLIFELPLVIAFLVKAGLLQVETLRKNRRFAIVIIFIVAAALTPGPDVFSQLMMAGPLIILYEAGVIIARIIERRK
jgi:sec-independent protein translocase protein TatC